MKGKEVPIFQKYEAGMNRFYHYFFCTIQVHPYI